MNGLSIDENKIDSSIRFFLYVLIFWLPYSSAVIESCVIISLLLWILKRGIIAGKQKKLIGSSDKQLSGYLKCFKPASSPINRPIALFLTVCLFSVAGSSFFEQSWHNFLTKTIEWFIVYFLVIEVFSEARHIYTALAILVFTTFATAIDSIIQYHITYKDIFLGHVIEPGARATAGFKTSNALGAYLSLVIPLILSGFFLNGKNLRYKYLSLSVLLLAFWSLFVTFSRGAWIGTLLGLILFVMILCLHKQKKVFFISFLLLSVTFILWIYFGLVLTNSVDLETVMRHRTVQWRLDMWKDCIVMIKDRLFFGHGINTFMMVYESYRSGSVAGPTYAHNCYIQLAAETGILGLLTFLWIIGVLFKESFRKIIFFAIYDRRLMIISTGLLSGIFAFLIHSFFDTNFYSLKLSVYLWFMIGIMAALINQKNSEELCANGL